MFVGALERRAALQGVERLQDHHSWQGVRASLCQNQLLGSPWIHMLTEGAPAKRAVQKFNTSFPFFGFSFVSTPIKLTTAADTRR
jgi:hypothetical protein